MAGILFGDVQVFVFVAGAGFAKIPNLIINFTKFSSFEKSIIKSKNNNKKKKCFYLSEAVTFFPK